MIKEKWDQGHFYSVLPHIDRTTVVRDNVPVFDKIDYNDASHQEIIRELPRFLKDFRFHVPGIAAPTPREHIIARVVQARDADLRKGQFNYYQVNNVFEWMDARMLYYYLRKYNPDRIIEIGSGWSTMLMHDVIQQFGLKTKITCIEPYPQNGLLMMHERGFIDLRQEKLEDTDLSIFESLGENDICFIDSSHVVKHNSDCLCYVNNILPKLRKGVRVHIHDIFLPYEYPESWYKEGRFWNEQYFVYAFLMNNSKYAVTFANAYATKFQELVELLRNSYEYRVGVWNDNDKAFGGGSLWLEVLSE